MSESVTRVELNKAVKVVIDFREIENESFSSYLKRLVYSEKNVDIMNKLNDMSSMLQVLYMSVLSDDTEKINSMKEDIQKAGLVLSDWSDDAGIRGQMKLCSAYGNLFSLSYTYNN